MGLGIRGIRAFSIMDKLVIKQQIEPSRDSKSRRAANTGIRQAGKRDVVLLPATAIRACIME